MRTILYIRMIHLFDEIINEQMINSKDFNLKNINCRLLTCYNNLDEIRTKIAKQLLKLYVI